MGLEQSVKGSDFMFDYDEGLFYKYHMASLHYGGSYIDSPKWLKNRKATINPKDEHKNDNLCYKFEVTIVLNNENIRKIKKEYQSLGSSQTNIIGKKTNFPTGSKEWKNFETSNKTIFLNVLFLPSKGGLK